MLIVERKALEVVRVVGGLLPRVGRGSRELGEQLDRASLSVPLNLAEGLRSYRGNRTARLYTALGSARETTMALRIAEARGYLRPEDIEAPLGLLDEVCAMAFRLAEKEGR